MRIPIAHLPAWQRRSIIVVTLVPILVLNLALDALDSVFETVENALERW